MVNLWLIESLGKRRGEEKTTQEKDVTLTRDVPADRKFATFSSKLNRKEVYLDLSEGWSSGVLDVAPMQLKEREDEQRIRNFIPMAIQTSYQ